MSDLFRKEVIDKQSQRHLGDVFLITPLSFWAVLGLIGAIITGLFVVAIFGEYARKERVVGTLTPDKGLVRVIPQQSGTFENIHVESGQNITVGDVLFEVNYDTTLKKGDSVSEALLDNMRIEKENLVTRLQTTVSQFDLTKGRLEVRKAELVLEAERATKQIDIQRQSVKIEEEILNRMKKLFASDAASALEVSSQESRYLQNQQTLNDFKNNKEKLLAEVKDIDAQISLLPIEQAQAEGELKNQMSSLEQSIIRTDAGANSVVISPVSGKIASVTARKGQTALPRNTAISILPAGGTLQAELFVPTRAAGFIQKGQSVRLLYDAFPYQKFGFYTGTIENVSKTVVNTSEISISAARPESVFLATVVLDRQSIDARNQQFPLQSGMSLSADIILEERKIWEWILEPFLGGDR